MTVISDLEQLARRAGRELDTAPAQEIVRWAGSTKPSVGSTGELASMTGTRTRSRTNPICGWGTTGSSVAAAVRRVMDLLIERGLA